MVVIAVEGNDGAGKSSLIKKIKMYYKSKGVKVLVVRYNMSYTTLPAIKEGKRRLFSPQINTLLHYASIKDQYLQFVEKFIRKGYLIIWDRYIYSVCARGLARGVEKKEIDHYLSEIQEVDAVIFLNISPVTAYARLSGKVNYWESGLDVIPSNNKYESFVKFQNRVLNEFEGLLTNIKSKKTIDASSNRKDVFIEAIEFLNDLEINVE